MLLNTIVVTKSLITIRKVLSVTFDKFFFWETINLMKKNDISTNDETWGCVINEFCNPNNVFYEFLVLYGFFKLLLGTFFKSNVGEARFGEFFY